MGEVNLKNVQASKRGTMCPACARPKPPGNSVCGRCFRGLPRFIRNGLYLPLNDGYTPAFRAAMVALIPGGKGDDIFLTEEDVVKSGRKFI